RRLKAHGYFPFVLNQICGDLLIHVEKVTDSAAVWTALDRLLAEMLPVNQNLSRTFRALLGVIGHHQGNLTRGFDWQIERKPFPATSSSAAHRPIDCRFFTLLIECLLFFCIARLHRADGRGFE